MIWAFLLASASAAVTILYGIFYIVSSAGFFAGTAIFNIIIGAGLFVLAVMMRNGAEWGRIVLAVLAGLGALFGLIALFQIGFIFAFAGGMGAVLLILMLLQIASAAGTLFFLFQADSNAYFKSAAPAPASTRRLRRPRPARPPGLRRLRVHRLTLPRDQLGEQVLGHVTVGLVQRREVLEHVFEYVPPGRQGQVEPAAARVARLPVFFCPRWSVVVGSDEPVPLGVGQQQGCLPVFVAEDHLHPDLAHASRVPPAFVRRPRSRPGVHRPWRAPHDQSIG
ncbi:hypothetical protein GCM10029964_113610 [Kibdelosporangium lantanae]